MASRMSDDASTLQHRRLCEATQMMKVFASEIKDLINDENQVVSFKTYRRDDAIDWVTHPVRSKLFPLLMRLRESPVRRRSKNNTMT